MGTQICSPVAIQAKKPVSNHTSCWGTIIPHGFSAPLMLFLCPAQKKLQQADRWAEAQAPVRLTRGMSRRLWSLSGSLLPEGPLDNGNRRMSIVQMKRSSVQSVAGFREARVGILFN